VLLKLNDKVKPYTLDRMVCFQTPKSYICFF